MDNLRVRMIGYIQMEELSNFLTKVQYDRSKNGYHDNKDRLNRPKYKKSQQLKGLRYKFYTPLATNCVSILEEACHIEIFPFAFLSKIPKVIDAINNCRYHLNYGHTMKDCWTLRDKIK
ncbi:hypothetical protein CR513_00338, partial [Mucuna pruriens]